MKAVYIAGPFRGANAWEIEQNIQRAEAVAAQVCALGALAVCPHTMFRNFQGLLPDQFWLDATLELLRRCDAVLMTGRWSQSDGSCGEHRDACDRGLHVFYTLDEVRAWLKGDQDD